MAEEEWVVAEEEEAVEVVEEVAEDEGMDQATREAMFLSECRMELQEDETGEVAEEEVVEEEVDQGDALAVVEGEEVEAEAEAAEEMEVPVENGFVFMCNDATQKKCEKYQLLGSPDSAMKPMLTHVKQDGATILFLFNITSRTLIGPFKAVSEPARDIEPTAFGGKLNAQVRVKPESLPVMSCQLEENCPPGLRSLKQVDDLRAKLMLGDIMADEAQALWTQDEPSMGGASAASPTTAAAAISTKAAQVPAAAAQKRPLANATGSPPKLQKVVQGTKAAGQPTKASVLKGSAAAAAAAAAIEAKAKTKASTGAPGQGKAKAKAVSAAVVTTGAAPAAAAAVAAAAAAAARAKAEAVAEAKANAKAKAAAAAAAAKAAAAAAAKAAADEEARATAKAKAKAAAEAKAKAAAEAKAAAAKAKAAAEAKTKAAAAKAAAEQQQQQAKLKAAQEAKAKAKAKFKAAAAEVAAKSAKPQIALKPEDFKLDEVVVFRTGKHTGHEAQILAIDGDDITVLVDGEQVVVASASELDKKAANPVATQESVDTDTLLAELAWKREELKKVVCQLEHAKPFLNPGRIIACKDNKSDLGWGILLEVNVTAQNQTVLKVFVAPESHPAGQVRALMFHRLQKLSQIRAKLTPGARDGGAKLLELLDGVRYNKKFLEVGPPLLDPVSQMRIKDPALPPLVESISALETKLQDLGVSIA
eukprot:CAMPEP_0206449330 /NCGR_PEP_ID=MMETSP0324_2-20121206/18024_1 /ASSEMBLY_ACC=CAM_ASM_000836 /TAXON_ID=2866 /ORGANISM="Crypthecodinium cohnii, Strain Seligo" /LENGTH=703 /DNA_ID=CAMNT_0053918685 /DNA_START=86 /DNA_END=2197 /DNA_ORIENTATION=+